MLLVVTELMGSQLARCYRKDHREMECAIPDIRNLRTSQRRDNKSWGQKMCGRQAQSNLNKINQLISGHTKLKDHWAEVTNSQDRIIRICSNVRSTSMLMPGKS